jgi:hypothetical protein
MGRSLEQFLAYARFERPDCTTHGGLGDPEIMRRAGNAPRLCHCLEGSQQAEIDATQLA